MGLVKDCRKWTDAKAKGAQFSGKLEAVFFLSVYKVAYVAGLGTSKSVACLLYSNAVKLIIVLLVCGEVWYGFTEASGLDEIVSSINATVIQFITIYRYKNMMEHKGIYNQLAKSMNSPYFDISTDKRTKLVDYWAQKNERYLKLLLMLGNCTLAAWFIFPLVDELEYNLIVGIRLPFDYKTPALYVLAYIMVVIAFTYISYLVMVTDMIMQAHLIHLLCQFDVLADCFKNLLRDCKVGFEGIPEHILVNNKKFIDKYSKRLGNLVKQHKQILSYTMDMRNSLSGPMLGQLAGSGTLICFVGYQAATTIAQSLAKGLMSVLFLGYNAFELYIICRWCEEITTQSRKIGEAIYCSGWECGVSQARGVRSTIMFVIARANDPLVLTAGGMYELSLSSYATLVKTSYSAFTILLRFRHG